MQELDMNGQNHAEPRFSDHEVREILTKALAVDELRSELISFQELQATARDVGISAHALDEAMKQVLAGREVRPLHRRSLWESCLWMALGGAIAGTLSLAATQTYAFPIPLPALAALMISGGVAFARRHCSRLRAALEFQIKNTALFVGYGATLAVVLKSGAVVKPGSFTLGYLAATVMMVWGGTSIFGAVVTLIRKKDAGEEEGRSAHRVFAQFKRVARRRMIALVDRIFAESRMQPHAERS
jgi:hypothetical protein